MQLSKDQISAYDNIMRWYKHDKIKRYALAGYAGTGKTTLAKHISQEIGGNDTIFCAFTGKAANVLREKGCSNPGTIHSYLYKYVRDESGKPHFTLNYESPIREAKLVIVDEYSMLPDEIINDLEMMGKRILYLGDPFQLPPVTGKCPIEADCFMEEIHRQALDSDIIRAATKVRLGDALSYCDEPEFIYTLKKHVGKDIFLGADQTIVGYNATRRLWNNKFLSHLGFEDSIDHLAKGGEKLVCLKNAHDVGLFNGMIGTCVKGSYDGNRYDVTFLCDGNTFDDLSVWPGDMQGRDSKEYRFSHKVQRFDYAYAITAHKSQGSEFDKVLILNQPIGKEKVDRRKWLYTAITRGKKKVILVDE